MKAILIAALALGLTGTGSLVIADTRATTAVETRKVRQLESVEPRSEDSRLIRKSRRVFRQRDGERVVITRRTYEDPTGSRTVRETRSVIE